MHLTNGEAERPASGGQLANQTLDMRGMRNGTKPFTLARAPCTLVNEPNGIANTLSNAIFCMRANAAWRSLASGRVFMSFQAASRSASPLSPFGRYTAFGSAKNCIVARPPSAGCVPHPVKKKFQLPSETPDICTEVGQSTTFICAL